MLNWLQLLIGISGLGFGVALAHIAPEEINPGMKYFKILRVLLLLAILGFLVYGFYQTIYLLIIPILVLILLVLETKFKSRKMELLYYALFIVGFYFYPNAVLAALIFIYGLPTGTLLMKSLATK